MSYFEFLVQYGDRILGGTLVKTLGYGSLGVAALVIDALAVIAFARIHSAHRVSATVQEAA